MGNILMYGSGDVECDDVNLDTKGMTLYFKLFVYKLSVGDPLDQERKCGLSQSYRSKWRGQYCSVPLCRNSRGQQAERERLGLPKISFHSFPKLDTCIGKMWIAKIRRDPGSEFVIKKHTAVCSEHFTADDFVDYLECPLIRRRLKPTAVPSIFAWTHKTHKRTSTTSKIACSSMQRGDYDRSWMSSVQKKSADDVEQYADHVECVDPSFNSTPCSPTKELTVLHQQVSQLQDALAEANNTFNKSLFRLENIKEKEELVKFYTGFQDYATLFAFYETILEADAKVMRQWDGKNSKDNYDEVKCGRTCKLPLLEQFFLTLVRLHLGLFELDLANRFSISQSTVSRITATWINLLYHALKDIEQYPPWHIVKKYMPEAFKKDYPNTRMIIDATEFFVERPSSLLSQACTFSSYKNRNTVKVLIGIMPSGTISFVSNCYEGSISDRKLVELSGLLDRLEPGDELMADKGFQIQDLLAPLGVRLNIPPFLTSKAQMPVADVILTRKIARLRIHVERAIGRIKEYHILQNVLPASMWNSINEVVYVCCMLANFGPPLVS